MLSVSKNNISNISNTKSVYHDISDRYMSGNCRSILVKF